MRPLFIMALLFITWACGASALAEETQATCTAFRLDETIFPRGPNEIGGTMEGMPIRDQKELGVCFANSAADLYDAWRFSNGKQCKPYAGIRPLPATMRSPSELSSPIEASIGACPVNRKHQDRQTIRMTNWDRPHFQTPQSHFMFPFEGGDPLDALGYLEKNGGCSVESVDRNKAFDGTLTSVNNAYLMFDGFHKGSKYNGNVCSLSGDLTRGGFLSSLGPHFDVLQDALQENSLSEYFDALVESGCSTRIRAPAMPPFKKTVIDHSGSNLGTSQQFIQAIHDHFDKNLNCSQPLEISYCAQIFAKSDSNMDAGSHTYIIENWDSEHKRYRKPMLHDENAGDLCRGFDAYGPEEDAAHSSTIIGRRWYNGRCEVLVRNSWGTNAYITNRGGVQADHGNIWVDETIIGKNAISFSSIGP